MTFAASLEVVHEVVAQQSAVAAAVGESNDSATHEDDLIHVLLLCKHKLPNNKATRELP